MSTGKSLLIPAAIAGQVRAALSQDEACAIELYARMAEHAQAYGVASYAGVLRGVVNALLYTWPHHNNPPLALVFGVRWAEDYADTEPCGPEHKLVRQGLADPDEHYGGQFANGPAAILTLFAPGVTHSSIRWLDPVGDRTIVVLPREYDAR